jgi:hypothetical protein
MADKKLPFNTKKCPWESCLLRYGDDGKEHEALCSHRQRVVCNNCPRRCNDEEAMKMHLMRHHAEQLIYVGAGKTGFRVDDRSAREMLEEAIEHNIVSVPLASTTMITPVGDVTMKQVKQVGVPDNQGDDYVNLDGSDDLDDEKSSEGEGKGEPEVKMWRKLVAETKKRADGLQKVVNSQRKTINYLLKQVGFSEEEAKTQMETTARPQLADDVKQPLSKRQKVSAPTTQSQPNAKSVLERGREARETGGHASVLERGRGASNDDRGRGRDEPADVDTIVHRVVAELQTASSTSPRRSFARGGGGQQRCFTCGGTGHWQSVCPNRQR